MKHRPPTIRDQCIEYLLGEMAEDALPEFERQLTASPQVNRELQIQSEILAALAVPTLALGLFFGKFKAIADQAIVLMTTNM